MTDIIDQTLGVLRDQRDNTQTVDLSGTTNINPQVFTTSKTLTIGPILFETTFTGPPVFSFAQQSQPTQSITADASSVIPFLVEPYVANLRVTNGVVDGFYIGLYALTPVPAGIIVHTIHWRAKGSASVYMDGSTDNSWTESYEASSPDFIQDDSSSDQFTDDIDTGMEYDDTGQYVDTSDSGIDGGDFYLDGSN